MRTARKILHRPAELVEAGLVPPERRAALETVAARYAVAITPRGQIGLKTAFEVELR